MTTLLMINNPKTIQWRASAACAAASSARVSVLTDLAGAPGIGPARARLAAGGSSSTLAGGGGECSGESCGVTGAGAAQRPEKAK